MLVHSPKREEKKKRKENDVVRLVLMRVNGYNGSNECSCVRVALFQGRNHGIICVCSESVCRQSQLLEVIPKKAVDCQEDEAQHTLIS